MIKIAELTGAHLDYWTARAQGTPAEHLEIRRVPRTDVLICVLRHATWRTGGDQVFPASTDWHLAGALLEQHRVDISSAYSKGWVAMLGVVPNLYAMHGPTPQVAICRAVVRAAFGDEVEEVAVCER